MNLKERKKRIQRWIGVGADGDFGKDTVAKLEKVLGITEHLKRKLPPQRPEAVEVGAEFDKRTEKNLATLHEVVQPAFRKLVRAARRELADDGLEYRALSGTRTWEEQDKLYAQGRTKPGDRVTKARGGYSNHNFGIAVDFGVFRGGTYLDRSRPAEAKEAHERVSAIAKRLDLNWGGDWTSLKDYPHFEYDTGLTVAEMRKRVRRGEVYL